MAAGPTATLEVAGAFAVSPTGSLYVVDEARHEVLVRLGDGQFRAVAGDGRDGFAGDGGLATRAALSDISDIAFAPDGDLYIADGARVRAVGQDGMIRAVAGDGATPASESAGGPPTEANGTPALKAALGPSVSIAFGPTGELYLATENELLRLTAAGKLAALRAVVRAGPGGHGPLNEFGQIAMDGRGDIYASSLQAGWSLYMVAPNGTATYLGYARRSGGNTAVLASAPGGEVNAGSASSILRLQGTHVGTAYTFNGVPGTDWFTLTYFSVAKNGTIYADDISGSGFQRYQQLVAVADGHVRALWEHPNY
jgi:glucose/arabinose dehydrogenase